MAKPQIKLAWYFRMMNIDALTLHQRTKIAQRTCYSIINGTAFPCQKNLIIIHRHFPQISLTYLFSNK